MGDRHLSFWMNNSYKPFNEEKKFTFFIVVVAFFSIFSLFGGIMEPDGALYASIAKNMILRDDWINLYVRGQDWLDKPHLTFWLAAISFKIFGINDFAYKLPSLLISWLGCWYIYQFLKHIYSRKIALIAVIIYLTAFHIIISNFDVRAEIYLSTFTFAGIYYYYKGLRQGFFPILAGSFYLACAVMVKGIFVLIPVIGAFVCYWLITKQWKEFLRPKWWLALALVGVFIIPELYTLYVQFDSHPEKLVFDRQGVSGLKFFFWDSQFGRFFNTGPIKGKGDLFFFVHTTLWAFLPWSLLFIIAVVSGLAKKLRSKRVPEMLLITASAGITFVLFSLSKFQLPHYIVIIIPQFSIITAIYLGHVDHGKLRTLIAVQHFVFFAIISLIIALLFVFKLAYTTWIIVLLVTTVVLAYFKLGHSLVQSIVWRSSVVSIVFMLFAYGFFYPQLLKYESGREAGLWLKKHRPKNASFVYGAESFAFDFYAPGEVKYVSDVSAIVDNNTSATVIFTSKEHIAYLQQVFKVRLLEEFHHFHITKLKKEFLYYKTRPTVLGSYALIEVSK
ncbi:glycosyltransferase family 39 protein [Olivibacter sp. SDN3]|uniref:ArnT family glycosyltransferase n=1 Tax=Olivibacter sp. SDN3 TaxID=2764720 RepID=UPI001651664C|nr:glycosyltransferase family 39 protein [Olivibacter sp. SDN3]QNL49307.1 glycosyltransferase family 39 protein [Olivibacter sp. SDN3]